MPSAGGVEGVVLVGVEAIGLRLEPGCNELVAVKDGRLSSLGGALTGGIPSEAEGLLVPRYGTLSVEVVGVFVVLSAADGRCEVVKSCATEVGPPS